MDLEQREVEEIGELDFERSLIIGELDSENEELRKVFNSRYFVGATFYRNVDQSNNIQLLVIDSRQLYNIIHMLP